MNELRWCNHVKVTPNPVFGSNQPHAGVKLDGLKGLYIALQDNNCLVLCPACFHAGIQVGLPVVQEVLN